VATVRTSDVPCFSPVLHPSFKQVIRKGRIVYYPEPYAGWDGGHLLRNRSDGVIVPTVQGSSFFVASFMLASPTIARAIAICSCPRVTLVFPIAMTTRMNLVSSRKVSVVTPPAGGARDPLLFLYPAQSPRVAPKTSRSWQIAEFLDGGAEYSSIETFCHVELMRLIRPGLDRPLQRFSDIPARYGYALYRTAQITKSDKINLKMSFL